MIAVFCSGIVLHQRKAQGGRSRECWRKYPSFFVIRMLPSDPTPRSKMHPRMRSMRVWTSPLFCEYQDYVSLDTWQYDIVYSLYFLNIPACLINSAQFNKMKPYKWVRIVIPDEEMSTWHIFRFIIVIEKIIQVIQPCINVPIPRSFLVWRCGSSMVQLNRPS